MSLSSWGLVLVLMVGGALFLYGSNYYDAAVGWTGVFLMIADVCVVVILGSRRFLMARRNRARTCTN